MIERGSLKKVKKLDKARTRSELDEGRDRRWRYCGSHKCLQKQTKSDTLLKSKL